MTTSSTRTLLSRPVRIGRAICVCVVVGLWLVFLSVAVTTDEALSAELLAFGWVLLAVTAVLIASALYWRIEALANQRRGGRDGIDSRQQRRPVFGSGHVYRAKSARVAGVAPVAAGGIPAADPLPGFADAATAVILPEPETRDGDGSTLSGREASAYLEGWNARGKVLRGGDDGV